MWASDETIAALASAPDSAARAILRISGPDTVPALASVFPAHTEELQANTSARRIPLQLFLDESVCVAVAVYLWPTARSYTGEPMAELHFPGARPLVEEIQLLLFSKTKIRPAGRGEFTLRAFLNGRIDLVQAEAVLSVIDAPDHEQLERALEQLAGGVSTLLRLQQQSLIALLGDLEAGLDFVEEDIEFVSRDQLLERLTTSREEIQRLLRQSRERMSSTQRSRVVLAGPPNAGKSTLFNAIVQQHTALVSSQRGTTRDYLSQIVKLPSGLEIELIDTAGMESTDSQIDAHAQSQSDRQRLQADLLIWCVPPDQNLSAVESEMGNTINVGTKSDLLNDNSPREPALDLCVAVQQESQGVAELLDLISQRLTDAGDEHSTENSISARCRESLESADSSLSSAIAAVESGMGDEITALEIRDVLDHIGRILGEVYTDDILDHIFSSFCIGK